MLVSDSRATELHCYWLCFVCFLSILISCRSDYLIWLDLLMPSCIHTFTRRGVKLRSSYIKWAFYHCVQPQLNQDTKVYTVIWGLLCHLSSLCFCLRLSNFYTQWRSIKRRKISSPNVTVRCCDYPVLVYQGAPA